MKFIVVVDCQKDFIDGSLGTKEAQEMIPRLVNKIEAADIQDTGFIFTRDTHDENYLATDEGKALPVVHCVKGTEGWQIDPRISDFFEECFTIDKNTFGSSALCEQLVRDIELIKQLPSMTPITEIEFVGLCTDICVVSNALMLKAYLGTNSGITVSVDSSCCAGTTPAAHEAALRVMESCQIVVK